MPTRTLINVLIHSFIEISDLDILNPQDPGYFNLVTITGTSGKESYTLGSVNNKLIAIAYLLYYTPYPRRTVTPLRTSLCRPIAPSLILGTSYILLKRSSEVLHKNVKLIKSVLS